MSMGKSYKIVWKANGNIVPHYYGKKFKSKKEAWNKLKNNVSGYKMSIRKR